MTEKWKNIFGLIFKKIFSSELIIIFLFLFIVNNYFRYSEKTINADGVAYYEYLPSIFIHKDFVRKDVPFSENASLYKRIKIDGFYIDYGDYKIDKYSCGTAILEFPFFYFTLLTTDLEGNFKDGYQLPFQKAIFYAALFYVFLSLILLRRILQLYDIKKYIIVFCQLLLVFSTSVFIYVNEDPGFSHIYSLFAITAFVYYTKAYFEHKNLKYFLFACLCFSLVITIRQVNGMVVFFIPFLAGSFLNLKQGLKAIYTEKKILFLGLIACFTIFFFQMLAWYLQTGEWLVYSYQGELFYFDNPEIFNILFSFKKGLFVYSPFIFICTICSFSYLFKKEYYSFFTWVFFFLFVTYVLSSWWSWYYGCSYGLRAYIDYYIIFLIPFAVLLNKLHVLPKILVLLISLATIPINMIQSYQFKNFILHWIDMDKEKYWKVFFKTDKKYNGLVWKHKIDLQSFNLEKEIKLGDIYVPKNTTKEAFKIKCSELPNFEKNTFVQVVLDSEFNESTDEIASLIVKENEHYFYFQSISLLNFHEIKLNHFHTGLFNFNFEAIPDFGSAELYLYFETKDRNTKIKNVKIKFLSPKTRL